MQLMSFFLWSAIAAGDGGTRSLDTIYDARASVVMEKFQPVTAPIDKYSVTVSFLEASLKPKYWSWVDRTDTYNEKTKEKTSVRFFMSVDPSRLSPLVEVKKYTDSAYLVNFYCSRNECVRSIRQKDDLLTFKDHGGWVFRDEESAKTVATHLRRMITLSGGKE